MYNKRMRKIFVVGNIGCGKTTFCKMLEEELTKLGRAVARLDLDNIALGIAKNVEIIQQIKDEFGDYKTREDLARIVFKSKDALDRLNEITHPYIYEQMLINFENYEEMGTDYVIVEETAYQGHEDRFARHADFLVCVICDEGLRQARCIEKGMHLVDFAQRTTLQVPQMSMMEDADIIINNNNDAVSLREKVIHFINSFN